MVNNKSMSLDFIPLPYYTAIYHHLLLLVTLVSCVRLHQEGYRKVQLGFLLLLFVLIYMGLRPISGVYFGDMGTYSRRFEYYQEGNGIIATKDVVFHYFMLLCSKFMSVHMFFLVCAALYVFPLYSVSVKWFKEYWFYAFLMLVGSFSFWSAGTNGIRNGIATSIFLLAISRDQRVLQIVLLIVATSIHQTILLPGLGFVITWFYNKPKVFFYFWLATIPMSLTLPGFWENLFGSIVEDERSFYFTDDTFREQFSQTGFRWDFLLYSAMGVFAGGYYIFKNCLEDRQYWQLFNTFLFANAFWILVIRASFSNRFAYLSWFMMALVIIYPWLKYYFERNQATKLAIILLFYYGFTYFMNVFLL